MEIQIKLDCLYPILEKTYFQRVGVLRINDYKNKRELDCYLDKDKSFTILEDGQIIERVSNFDALKTYLSNNFEKYDACVVYEG